ncbi:hypothetical protein ABZ816_33305 [Actinosynnema sp. NPDC047251]|uniref:hypothetical protein n=1 Tax=Saccharothrix espanaensis TaxID=103731 RepID=UPI0011DDCF3C|nr:hypothetical protein [Saccharothrix espanaensis]
MESVDPLEKNIAEWLKRQGYILEVRAARAFLRAHPLQEHWGHSETVEQGVHYLDPQESKLREIDVVASWWNPVKRSHPSITRTNGDAWLGLTVVIECKRSQVPWILLAAERHKFHKIPQWLDPLSKAYIADFRIYSGYWAGTPLGDSGVPVAHSIVPRVEKNPDRNAPFDAVRQVISATTSLLEQGGPGEIDQPWIDLFVPVLVTDAPLFVCRLDNEGDIVVKSVEYGVYLDAENGRTRHQDIPVYVVNIAYIDQFAQMCHNSAELLWGQPSGQGDELSEE